MLSFEVKKIEKNKTVSNVALLYKNGLLLHCMHKQQDFFGCLAEILGCLGLREAANLEI